MGSVRKEGLTPQNDGLPAVAVMGGWETLRVVNGATYPIEVGGSRGLGDGYISGGMNAARTGSGVVHKEHGVWHID